MVSKSYAFARQGLSDEQIYPHAVFQEPGGISFFICIKTSHSFGAQPTSGVIDVFLVKEGLDAFGSTLISKAAFLNSTEWAFDL